MTTHLVVLAAALWAAPVLAQPATQVDGKGIAPEDRAFLEEAASGGTMEVQLGRLAAERAVDPDIKAFGRHMVEDHAKANERLKDVARREHVTLDTGMLPKHQAEVDRLGKLRGAEFDRAYLTLMRTDHAEDVKKFEQEARSGKNPSVKQFAQETLPTLRQHLARAEQITTATSGAKPAPGAR
jgi:putative membrane protein